eukprot:gene22854-27153_t
MVCDRCILIVRQQLENLHFKVSEISLGKVLGFELIDKQKDQLVEQIKTKVIELVHYSDLNEINQSLLTLIADALHKEYTYLSRLFSDAEGLTIEKYII